MYLSALNVQHYKSLDNVTVDFQPDVTVIVGPNGVGKSNFVDVLRFLRDVVVDDLEHAITKREGIGRLLQSYRTKPYKIGIQTRFSSTEIEYIESAEYDTQLKAVGKSSYAVDSEKMSYVCIPPNGVGNKNTSFDRNAASALESDTLELSTRGQENPVAAHISAWNYCTIYPNTLKKPALPDRDNELNESGENWASVIKALKRSPKGRESVERIYEAMRTVIPGFVDVGIQTVGAYLVPLFNFRNDNSDSITGFDPVQLSDGTLRLFGILLAAYQLPRPKLLVIEEPEQTIYPGALAVLADVFKEVGKSTQVIITTHSPHLAQHFAPEQIRVATMQHGLTSIRTVHPHQIEAVHEGLMSVDEFMLGEGLRPDDTPLPQL